MSTVAARPSAPRAAASEAEFQAFVLDALALGGWLTYHETDSRKSPSGLPDIIACHPERGIIFAELKTDRGRVRPEQECWLAVLSASIGGGRDALLGGQAARRIYVRLWRPSDFRDVLEVTGVSAIGDVQ